jgi:hypothetical protein
MLYYNIFNHFNILMDKFFGVFISTFIRSDNNISILIDNIKLLQLNLSETSDIYILNDSHDCKDKIRVALVENNMSEVNVVNIPSVGCAYVYMYELVQTLGKKYNYYVNLHDTVHLITPLPKLNNDYYYLWKLPEAWVLDNHSKNLIQNLINSAQLDINIEEVANNWEEGNYWFMFGCLSILKEKHVNLVYNCSHFKKIYNHPLTRNDRIALEFIVGYICHKTFADKNNISYIEPKAWSQIKPEIHPVYGVQVWAHTYFKKISCGR